jgi:hypothetical protein
MTMAQGLWIDTVRKGLAANRPVTADPPPDGFVFYFAYDTGMLSMWTGSAWEDMQQMAVVDSGDFTPGTGVSVADVPMSVRKLTLTLDGVELAVTEALDYGSVELTNLPDKNLLILGCEASVSIVKGETENGIITTTDLDVSIGTAAASATTLATTMLNILPKQDLDADTATVTLAAHSLATTPVLTGVLDTATSKVYFNAVPIGGITADDTLTLTGTVTIFYIDLGNITS